MSDRPLTTAVQHIIPRDPAARPARLACSGVDLLWVMSYAPGHGHDGTPIAVNFACNADPALAVNIRLVVGRRAVATHVRETDSPGGGRWQLTGVAPAFAKQNSSSKMVPLTIQAVDNDDRVVDSVTFGDFVYHLDGPDPPTGAADPPKRPSPYSQPQSPPSSDSEHATARPGAQSTTPALRRASRQMGSEPEDPTHTVVLDIATPLDSFCFDWEESELHAGRRLVRFRRLQDGNTLIVSAERIMQTDYDPDDIVISCIYRQETDSCCVTSVDIIHLLQRLVDADFEVDEKNRIRRNLEGLRPITVSKTRPGFESFFQRIMDFPEPKPRKIEKDVKVFDWKLLPHALDKILSKYSLCPSPSASSPKDPVPSPPSGDTSAGSAAAPYDENPSQPQREPRLDALYLSPTVHLAPFSNDSPDSSPEMHHQPSLHEDHVQPVYLDPNAMQRYYRPDSELVYCVPTSGSPVYTAESSSVLARGTNAWATPSPPDVVFMSPYEPIYSSAYAYAPSDATDATDIFVTSPFPVNTFDSFEFSTLREHGAMLTTPHA